MRQGQHKNRSRNRGRRPSSPLSRVFESNGPDVKVRGTAQHVADKYLQLARDAQASGDVIMAENYYQHAEHYLRILAAASSYSQQSPGYQQGQPQFQNRRPGMDEDSLDEADETMSEGEGEQPGTTPSGGAAVADEEQRQETSPTPVGEEEGAEQAWGGPQPEFLRRSSGSGNGSGRSRRPRPARSGQGESASSSQSNSSESDQPVQPATE